MNILDITEVLNQQSVSGGFPSWIDLNGRKIPDENCFITALVGLHLLEFKQEETNPQLQGAIDKALDFILACESSEQAGAFRFYPYRLSTPRLKIPIDDDMDDTALALLLLLKTGRRDAKTIFEQLDKLLSSNLKHWISGRDPRWVHPGIPLTWVTGTAYQNPVDACVLTNVATLLAALNKKTHPVFANIIQCLTKLSFEHYPWRCIGPYYSRPEELYLALRRAIRFGVNELSILIDRWFPDVDEAFKMDRPICCNYDGRPHWYAPTLQLARHITFHYKTNLPYG